VSRLAALFLVLVAAAPLAANAQEPVRRAHLLWDPAGPGCVLFPRHVPRAARRLPAPYAPRRVSELYGPGITEDHLAAGLLSGLERGPKLVSADGGGADVVIVYTDDPGVGFWDPVLGPARRAALEFATALAAGILDDADLVISLDASFPDLGEDGPLAAGAATAGWQDDSIAVDTYFGEPLFSHLTGADPDTDQLDVAIQFNAYWDGSPNPFDYGLDAAVAPNATSFVTVALHEFVHGLDFADSFQATGGIANDDPFIYDRFVVDGAGTPLLDLPDVPATVTSGAFWSGGVCNLGWRNHMLGGDDAPLFAPPVFDAGSSIAHFDEAAFTGPWALMSPEVDLGEAVLAIDPTTRGLLTDLGWRVRFDAIYVSPGGSILELGLPHQPFGSLADAVAASAVAGKPDVYLASGTYGVTSLVIDTPAVLRGWPGGAVVE